MSVIEIKNDRYCVCDRSFSEEVTSKTVFADIKFQSGTIIDNGENGCQVKDVLLLAQKRLKQLNGMVSCKENGESIECIQQAIDWLIDRTNDRKRRGVEGTNKK